MTSVVKLWSHIIHSAACWLVFHELQILKETKQNKPKNSCRQKGAPSFKSFLIKINFQVKVKNTPLTWLDFSVNCVSFRSVCRTSGPLLSRQHSYASWDYSDVYFKCSVENSIWNVLLHRRSCFNSVIFQSINNSCFLSDIKTMYGIWQKRKKKKKKLSNDFLSS